MTTRVTILNDAEPNGPAVKVEVQERSRDGAFAPGGVEHYVKPGGFVTVGLHKSNQLTINEAKE